MSRDARSLSSEAQEALRWRVIAALRGGIKPAVVARIFGVSRSSVWNWRRRVALGNSTSLRSRKRGRPQGSRLAPRQGATMVRLITDRCPDQLKLPFAMWTREAVQHLLAERFGVQVSVCTVGRYLAAWGFKRQKPLRRAYECDPAALQRWLEVEYPAIQRQEKAENAEVHWGDEMGLRSDHQTGTSYGRRRQTPVIPGTGRRFRCDVLSTITNRGHLAFMVFKQRFKAAVLLRSVRRLVRQVGRKVLLIVDRHPVHRGVRVQRWLACNAQRLELLYLPVYSPEPNPNKCLNQDVESNALGWQRLGTYSEMMAGVRSYLRSTQRQLEIVKSYFRAEHVRYAAG